MGSDIANLIYALRPIPDILVFDNFRTPLIAVILFHQLKSMVLIELTSCIESFYRPKMNFAKSMLITKVDCP